MNTTLKAIAGGTEFKLADGSSTTLWRKGYTCKGDEIGCYPKLGGQWQDDESFQVFFPIKTAVVIN